MDKVTQVDPIFNVFKDMVRKAPVSTKRKCLRCKKVFKSGTSGNRICADCNFKNNTPASRSFYNFMA